MGLEPNQSHWKAMRLWRHRYSWNRYSHLPTPKERRAYLKTDQPKSQGEKGQEIRTRGLFEPLMTPCLEPALTPGFSLIWPKMPLCAEVAWLGLSSFCMWQSPAWSQGPLLHPSFIPPTLLRHLRLVPYWFILFLNRPHPWLPVFLECFPIFPHWNYTPSLRFSSDELSS